MSAAELVAVLSLLAGCGFYFAGTVGLLRFPDTFSRLHALTKADNLGLLLVCVALALHAASLRVAFLLTVVWLLAQLAATVSAHLIARRAEHDLEKDG
ncbi:monovalent cation/H(+) antiporter subunit G [Rehaibacterium terrae]|uniref:Multicomponent Na+:H+ antiporter subunit G n=1 Tax=Rehaibacterium terrae TaxID=1341696 RepID=A0A7W7V749_9GAMM|nr:multicomponent Na+:H+ antiporter subunit G [Rehaibacterium terrae]